MRLFFSGEVWHIFNKSIAGFKIFAQRRFALRFLKSLVFYNTAKYKGSFSKYMRQEGLSLPEVLAPVKKAIVKVIAYCVMPDHYHLMAKVQKGDKVSKLIGDIENSFTRFFNLTVKRKGPLWESRFKAVRVDDDSYFSHLTRYIHLNPVSDGLVDKPEDWEFSSYKDYITDPKVLKKYITEIEIDSPERYKRFVYDRLEYQKYLKKIRRFLREDSRS